MESWDQVGQYEPITAAQGMNERVMRPADNQPGSVSMATHKHDREMGRCVCGGAMVTERLVEEVVAGRRLVGRGKVWGGGRNAGG